MLDDDDVGSATRMHSLIAGGTAVMNIVLFTLIGVFAFESSTYGALAGLFSGVGSYLFLPTFMRVSAVQEAATDDLPISEAAAQADGSPQLTAIGFGMEAGGVLMLVAGFATNEPEHLLGAGVAVAATIVVAVVGSVLLRQ